MLPYSRGLIIDNTNNYGIVKTETVFGFRPKSDSYVNNTFNSSEPLEWWFTHGKFGQESLQDSIPSESRSLKEIPQSKVEPTTLPPETHQSKKAKKNKKKKKLHRQGKGKHKKCIFKVIKKGSKKKRGHNKFPTMQKKYMMPLILGLLAAKSLLIPVALKALAFLSAKGLIMGFFSTVMASVLSLKGMFDHSHHYQNRKDDAKTQVEIIQVPTKTEDHVYYDDHYKRNDYEQNVVPDGYILRSVAFGNQ